MRVLVLVVCLVASFATLPAAPAHAKLTPVQKCALAKEKATAKKVADKIKCYRKTKLAAPDPACLQKAEEKFAAAFAKAEAPGACKVSGDADSVEATVDALVNTLVQALQPSARSITPAQKCSDTKLGAASNDTTAQLKCHQQSLSTGSTGLLALCLATAEGKLDTAFTNAEAPGGCATSGDAGAIKDTVNTFVNDTTQTLAPPIVPPGATATPTGGLGPSPTPGGAGGTRCCQPFGWPTCFDADALDAIYICGVTGGTVAPAGEVCDGGGTGLCGSVKSIGACCQCNSSQTSWCFEAPTSIVGGYCYSQPGWCPGGVVLGACGASSGTCGGP